MSVVDYVRNIKANFPEWVAIRGGIAPSWLIVGTPRSPRPLGLKKGQKGRIFYRLEKFLSRGTYGSVYLYLAPNGAKLALKVATKESECRDSSFYFADCAHIVEQRCLTKPGVGIGFREVDGTAYRDRYHCIVMEVLDANLFKVLRHHRLDAGAKEKIVSAVYHAFQCLVDQQKYYTDLKSNNVMINWAAPADEMKEVSARDIKDVKLVDLGSICALDDIDGNQTTFPPPGAWNAFCCDDEFLPGFFAEEFGAIPCTEQTAMWQVAIFVVGVYLGDDYISEYVFDKGPTKASPAEARAMFARVVADLTPDNFPNLWLADLRTYFRDPVAAGSYWRKPKSRLADLQIRYHLNLPKGLQGAPPSRRRSRSRSPLSARRRSRSPSPLSARRRSRSPSPLSARRRRSVVHKLSKLVLFDSPVGGMSSARRMSARKSRSRSPENKWLLHQMDRARKMTGAQRTAAIEIANKYARATAGVVDDGDRARHARARHVRELFDYLFLGAGVGLLRDEAICDMIANKLEDFLEDGTLALVASPATLAKYFRVSDMFCSDPPP